MQSLRISLPVNDEALGLGNKKMGKQLSIRRRVSASSQRRLICCYQNETALPQVICIRNTMAPCVERTVLPGQIARFEAQRDAVLEVRSSAMITAILSDRIPCAQLTCAVPLPARKVTAHAEQWAA